MQTIQLLGGPEGRAAFLSCALRHLLPDGALAIAIAEALDLYDVTDGVPSPTPDIRELDGVVYSSRPVAVRADPDGFVLERLRETVAVAGERTVERDLIRLDRLTARRARARGPGRRVRPRAASPGARDRGLRRQRGGDPPCLTLRACARCTRT